MKNPTVALLWMMLTLSGAAHAFTLDYPELGLASTPDDVRAWARAHQFTPAAPTPPMEEAYQREFTEGMPVRHVLSFAAGPSGLKMLSFEQFGILNAPAAIRRNIVQRFGKPSADQILPGGTLRITYMLAQPEAARRIFLIGSSSLSMAMFTAAAFAEQHKLTADSERAEAAAREQAKVDARNAWLMPLLWIIGIGVAGLAFYWLAPAPIRKPVVNVFGTIVGGLFNLVNEAFFQLFPIVLGVALLIAMILSGLMAGAGAVELGTSWWWWVPWLIGLAMQYKSHDDGEMKTAFVALAFYVGTLIGVMLENTLIQP